MEAYRIAPAIAGDMSLSIYLLFANHEKSTEYAPFLARYSLRLH